MAEKKVIPKSSSHDRIVTVYLRPNIQNRFEEIASMDFRSKSEALNEAVRLLIEKYRNCKKTDY